MFFYSLLVERCAVLLPRQPHRALESNEVIVTLVVAMVTSWRGRCGGAIRAR